MPEPIQQLYQRPQRQNQLFESELSSTLFNLARSSRYIHNGVEYKFDLDEYEERTSRKRNDFHSAQMDYDNGLITEQYLHEIADVYFKNICTYYLIDEDGKECGSFNTMTREYNIFYRRIQLNNQIYYCDTDNELTTYGNSYVGTLSENGNEIINHNFEILDVDELS